VSKPLFALIDCNNFFVSCERIFRPDLEGRPVVVLSSNDGCVVARSNEAKTLGIPMGAPAFKYRDVFEQHKVVRFSGNFELYGDISRRITNILTSVTPRTEIYSVDELFLDLSQLMIDDYRAWGTMIRDAIWRWVGIPVSVGIAPSKTLAKLATERAKKDPELGGVFSFVEASQSERLQRLAATPVSEVWGVGWRLAPKLRAEGVYSALELSRLNPKRAQQLMGITGRQMVAELGGTSCFQLEMEGRAHKSIARTRTFGQDTQEFHVLEAAIVSFATKAAFRLRSDGRLARRVSLFLTSNKHKPGYRSWGSEARLAAPTAETGQIISALVKELKRIYQPGTLYHRAGVLLYDFVPDHVLQTDILGVVDTRKFDRDMSRMAAVDLLNERFGNQGIRYAAELLGNAWKPKRQMRSPHYVSDWHELPKAKPK
jgi:DNA polymerase V